MNDSSSLPPPPNSVTAPMPPPPTAASIPRPAAMDVINDGITCLSVSKWFDDVVAVSEVSFAVGTGVTALLGPNGAGKSTLLRMISGQTTTSIGEVKLLGEDPRTSLEVRGRLGIVPQQETLFSDQRALDFVTLAGVLHGISDPEAAARVALNKVEMDPDDTRSLSTYSKGMRQRVKVAQAVVHDPKVVLMDEPLSGLDPRQRLRMIEMIRNLGTSGVTVLVSSHVLDEVERLGSNVLVIAQGRLVAQGDFHAIRDLMDDRPHRIRLRVSDARAVGGALLTEANVVGITIAAEDELVIETEDVDTFRRTIAAVARDLDVRLFEVDPLDDDLESVFRYLVGR